MISAIIAGVGAVLVGCRVNSLRKKTRSALTVSRGNTGPKVSVIVPARNEEHNIGSLLQSLKKVDYSPLEIVVVDDQSSDSTATIAERFGVKIIRGSARPPGWGGKQWACQQGAEEAEGEVLIFTDADTVHEKDSVKRALTWLEVGNLDMLSVVPRHEGKTIWESLTGFFQILLMFAANAFGRQVPGRAYCIGQYLMFKREAYLKIGGHASVREAIVEDVPLANRALTLGLRYDILTTESLYSVRMYDSLKSFIAGWRRNFRAGLKDSSPLATAEVSLVIGALIAGGSLNPGLVETAGFIFCVGAIYLLVRRYSNYGVLSILGIPFSIILFCVITGLAVFDTLLKKDIQWKGRAIPVK